MAFLVKMINFTLGKQHFRLHVVRKMSSHVCVPFMIDTPSVVEFSTFYMQRDNPQLRLSYQVDPTDPTSFDFATFNAKNGYNYG